MIKKRILITGGAGFIGFHLQNELAKTVAVTSMDLLDPTNEFVVLRSRILGTVQSGDIRKPFLLGDQRFNVLIHLAALTGISPSALNPQAYLDVNVNGTFNMLEEARKNNIKYIIYASSSSVYTPSEGPVAETSCTNHPLSFYGTTKKMAELIVENYCRQHGMIAIGLRFFTVYGSWTRPDMAAFKFLHAIQKETDVTIYNPHELKRDFTHVSDIVAGISRLISILPEFEPGTHEVFNIGFGQPLFVKDFAEALAVKMGKKLKLKEGIIPVNEVISTHADTNKLFQYTGYKPSVSVQQGIEELVDWYKQYIK